MVAPSGDQFEIAAAGYRAVVTESGATLRELTYDDRPLIDGFALEEVSPGGRGQLLMPWPNRLRDGAYRFAGRDLRLPLSEPARHNASHGLVRWAAWSREEDAVRGLDRFATVPREGNRRSRSHRALGGRVVVLFVILFGGLRLLLAFERRDLGLTPGVRKNQLDLLFDLFELLIAEAGEADSFFEKLERIVERKLFVLQPVHDFLELIERFFKLIGAAGGHVHGYSDFGRR